MKKKEDPPRIHLENITINNAVPVGEDAARSLEWAARAAEANALAIRSIAEALRGREARMETGVSLSNINT